MGSGLIPEEQHNIEIQQNLVYWKNKPMLQKIYDRFYKLIKSQVNKNVSGKIVELGSGVGNLKTVIPEAICTDLFKNPWIDQVENAYKLSFSDEEVSNIILFDVFHHLEYPGNVFDEFFRVLVPGGRIIIFDPDISLLGHIVYGILHHEPVKAFKPIKWKAPENTNLLNLPYYAAQGNAHRVFLKNKNIRKLNGFTIVKRKRLAAISYIFTGGYSKPQLLPSFLFKFLFLMDRIFSYVPFVFSTRIMVVLEKNTK